MAVVGGAAPEALEDLRARQAELADLHGVINTLHWDQNTYMPVAGNTTRGDQLGTLERLVHSRLVDPGLADTLDALETWAAGEDPDSDDARLISWTRRDHEKAIRVPERLAVAMAKESAVGYGAWLEARESGGFAHFRDALSRQIELRREYAACFPESAHPYDALLDDYEPGMTTAEILPLFEALKTALPPLVDAAAAAPEVLIGDFPRDAQRDLLRNVLAEVGFDDRSWRLDDAPHPFAISPGMGDVRITTRYRDDDLGFSLYSGLHEFGHGLYDANRGLGLRRTSMDECASLGVHESQSRMWENVIGRGRPFAKWLLPRLREFLPGTYAGMDPATLYRGLNGVHRTLIRTESDETTYNLHVALRLELELALIEGRVEVADLPAAWNEAMARLLGVEVPNDLEGVLQDVHWGIGHFGYFPTYTLGNLMAAQLWGQLSADVPDVDARIEAGDFAPIRAWLTEHIHQYGRKYTQRELLYRATGSELAVEPFLDYLTTKLRDAGVLA